MRKAQRLGQALRERKAARRVLFRGHDDEIRGGEHRAVRVLDAAHLAPGHWVAGDELHVRAQKALNLLHKAALDAAHVRQKHAGPEILLIFPQPRCQRARVQPEDHRVRLCQQRGKRLHRALGDDAARQRAVDCLAAHVDGRDGMARARQPHRVAAAQKAKTDDADVFRQAHGCTLPSGSMMSAPILRSSVKKPGQLLRTASAP